MAKIVYYVPDVGFSDDEKARRLSLMRPHVPAGYEIVFSSPPEGPEYVDSEKDFLQAHKAVQAHFPTIGPGDCDALLLGEALDAVIDIVRPLARVPLIAPGEEALRLAAAIGKPTSLVVMNQLDKGLAETFVENTVIKPSITSIRSMDIPMRQILAALDEVRKAVIKVARAAVTEDGAETIFLGAMTLNTLDLADQLRAELGVTVVDPLRIGLRVASEVAYSQRGAVSG